MNQKKWTQSMSNGPESLSEGMPAMKGFPNGLEQLGADENYNQIKKELYYFKDDNTAKWINLPGPKLARPAPVMQTITFGYRTEDDHGKQIDDQCEPESSTR